MREVRVIALKHCVPGPGNLDELYDASLNEALQALQLAAGLKNHAGNA